MFKSPRLQRKITGLLTLFSMFLNLAQPFLLAAAFATPVHAQVATDSGATPTPAPSTDPSMAPSPSASPIESVAPSASPSPSPDMVSPSPTPSLEPSPVASISPIPSDSPVPTNSPAPTDSSPAPPSSTAPTATPSVSPSPTPSVSPAPEIAKLAASILPNTSSTALNQFDFTVNESGSATLTTNKADYAPTDTAIITGAGFQPHVTYFLTVSSTDPPATSTTSQVQANDKGDLFYAYQLDGTYRPNYSVDVKLGSLLVATTTFTDSPSQADYKHWADKASANWQNGALQGSNSQYFEGESVPQYWKIEGLEIGQVYGFNIYYDYLDTTGSHNNCGFDYLSTYNASRSPTIIVGNTPTVSTAFPGGHGNIYVDGANALTITGPTTHGVQQYVQVKFTATNPTSVFYWGLHLALPGAVSGCQGSHAWTGASLQTNVDNDPNIQSAIDLGGGGTLQINPNAVIQGVISGYKWNDLNGNGLYDSGEEKLSGWTINLCSDSACTNILQTKITDNSGNYSFNMTPGNYYVGEVQQNGWEKITPATATYGPLVVNATTSTYSTENFGNQRTPISPTLKLVKVVHNNHGGTAVASNWTLTANGTGGFSDAGNSTTFHTVQPSVAYTLSESTLAGYSLTKDWVCDGGSLSNDQITLSAGQNVTCAIENSDIAPQLTVIKHVVIDNGGTKNASDFTMNVTGTNVSSTSFPGSETGTTITLNAGNYSVDEGSHDGYTETKSADCTGTIAVGQVKTCTITNDDQPGTLIVNKVTVPADTQTSFPITVSGTGNITSPTQNIVSGTPAHFTVDSGTYSVAEASQAGWSATGNTCIGVFVPSGGQASCTITNTKLGSINGFKWNDINGNGIWDVGEPAASGWLITLTHGSSVLGTATTAADGSYSFTGLLPDTYSLAETLQSSWTQTFGTSGVVLGAGQVSNNNNFGNFQNVSVKACKIEDSDGNLNTKNDQTSVVGWPVNLLIDGQISSTQSTGRDGCYTWGNLGPAHTYGVSEASSTAGWTALGDTTHDFGLAESGSNYSFSFINFKNAQIIVHKNVLGADGSAIADPTVFTSLLNTTNPQNVSELSAATYSDLGPGQYTVSEGIIPPGYHFVSATNGGVVNVTSGGTFAVTLTNQQNYGSITVHKMVDSTGTGSYVSGDNGVFTWNLDNTESSIMGSTDSSVIPGDHLVGENPVTNYHFVGWYPTGINGYSCTNLPTDGQNDYHVLPINVNVGPSGTSNFTLCNARDTGTITIIKDAQPDSSQSFDFTGNLGNFSLIDDGTGTQNSHTFSKLETGTYTITEPNVNGWDLTDVSCDSENADTHNRNAVINLAKDDNIICTFTNESHGSISGSKFQDSNADGKWDDGEPTIPNWTIFIDGNGNGILDNGEISTITDKNGNYSFGDLVKGDYSICEQPKDGWNRSYPTNNNCQTVTLKHGDTLNNVNFGNYQNGSLTVIKRVIDPSGNAVEGDSTSFNFGIDQLDSSFSLTNGGEKTFSVKPGSYDVLETGDGNYGLAGCTALYEGESTGRPIGEEDSQGINVTLDSGDSVVVTCVNQQKNGTISGFKWNDENGNHEFDCNFNEDREKSQCEPKLSDWTIFLDGNDNGKLDEEELSTKTDENGNYSFSVPPGTYAICEQGQSGWQQTYPQGDENNNCHTVTIGSNDQESGSDQNFGNQAAPVLRIQKTNNATGNKNPGDLVTYTLTVDLTGSPMTGVTVTDVPPAGFTYVLGSWTSSKIGVTEPSYGSPGTWNLGDMNPGDIVTLTYQAKISSPLDGGTYNDSAWAEGNSDNFGTILALGHDSPYVDPAGTFVGTSVTVNQDIAATGNANIVKTGEVLGASTSLPDTGVNTGWLLLAIASLITGLTLIFGGKLMKKILLVAFVTVSLCHGITAPVHAADPGNNLSIRIESPITPTRLNSWKLGFSVLDRAARTPVVTCYFKKPSTSGFTSFGAVHTSDKPTGDNGTCQVDSSVMNDQGVYEFYVTATAGSDSKDSDHVQVNYDTNGPGTPGNYSKEHPSICRWIIHFHTAADNGLTQRVEIYSSDQTSFPTDAGSRVGTITIGSNQDGSFTHDRGNDCDRSWYYVIRAFDSVGNQSDYVGDSVVNVTTVAGSASPVPALVLARATGNVLGEESVVASPAPEISPSPSPTTIPGSGLVMGAKDAIKSSLASHRTWWIVGLVAIILGAIYVALRRRHS